jgi:Fe-S-cluster-containing dehydrogenase component
MEYAIWIDITRCSGCQACAVACMDENDLDPEKGDRSWRQVFPVEEGTYPGAKISYVPLACTHCAPAPCIAACPTGAIMRLESGTVVVNAAACTGCHQCLSICPFGVPCFGSDGKMQKCTMCADRVEAGIEPACVRTCPTKALRFGPLQEADSLEAPSAQRLVWLGRPPILLP